jgi:protease-4
MGRRTATLLMLLALFPPAVVADAGAESPAAGGEAQTSSYAHIEVSGVLSECAPSVYLFEDPGETLFSLVSRIDRARGDAEVTGLILHIRPFAAGFAKVQELRAALAAFRSEGKTVICFLDAGSNLTYYLATESDRIVMPPAGALMLVGLRAEAIFMKGLLDKIGVEGQFEQAGRYKSGGETFTRREPSPAFRETLESIADSYYDQLLEGIAAGRGVPVGRAAALVRRGPYTVQAAAEAGLVDEVGHYEELLSGLRESHGGQLEVTRHYARRKRSAAQPPSTMELLNMLMGGPRPGRRRVTGPAVAVLYAVGPIIGGPVDDLGFGQQLVSAPAFIREVRRARDDDAIKAIVVRIDSPGGSASACDEIWRELRTADEHKPVVASFSDTAASGGYYLGAGCRRIFARPGALTGSIGVFGGKLVLSGLMEKIDLDVYAVERGGNPGMFSLFEGFSLEQRERLSDLLEAFYALFLDRVATTRPGMDADDVARVAEGRVWTGAQAMERGLVDEEGGLREAIAAAKAEAGIAAGRPVRIIHLPEPKSLLELLMFGPEEKASSQPAARVARPELLVLPAAARDYLASVWLMASEPAFCMMPAVISVR